MPAGAERPAAQQHEEHGDVGGERSGGAAGSDLRPPGPATQPGMYDLIVVTMFSPCVTRCDQVIPIVTTCHHV